MNILGVFTAFILMAGSLPPCDPILLRKLSRSAELIVIAEVAEVESDSFWVNDFLPPIRRVHYRVLSSLKGRSDKLVIGVLHYQMSRPDLRSCVQDKEPSGKFVVGRRVILFLVPDYGLIQDSTDPSKREMISIDIVCESIAANEINVAEVKASL